VKSYGDVGLKWPLVQILVVVETIQMRSLMSDVGMVSTRTVFDCGLDGPKGNRN